MWHSDSSGGLHAGLEAFSPVQQPRRFHDFRLAGISRRTQLPAAGRHSFLFSMSSLFSGRLFVLIGCVVALTGPAFSKPRYLHATTGNIDIVSSMSEERTTRFLHELVGLRSHA
jgi:hypothetical protein